MPSFTLRAPAPGQVEGRRMIQRAFDDLRKLVSPVHTPEFASTTLQDVKRAAIEVERELAGRQLLRNTRRLDALFRGLENYSKVIDVLCNGTEFLPWIWAPIKLVLKVSCDCTEAFESLVKAYAQISEHLGRFGLLQQSFSDKPELHPTFAAFYVDILAFHKVAYKFVTRRCWKILFVTSWGRFKQKLDNILEDLRRHGDLIDKISNAHNIVEAREMRQKLQSWKEASLHRLEQDEKEQKVRHLESITSWLGIDNSDQVLLRDSLVEIGLQHPGTADWILRRQNMTLWLQPNSKNEFLLLQGGPGTGKSVLSARLIRFLQAPGRSVVLSHFCSYSPSSSTRYDVIVKSLFLECVKVDHDLAAHIYDEHVSSKQASITLLEGLLETAVEVLAGGSADNDAVHIILDGVDECLADTQRKVFRLADRLVTNGPACKILVSGRSTMAAPRSKRWKETPTLSLSEEKACVGEAIRHFVTAGLGNMREKLMEMGLSDQSIRELASRIVAKADGMFLWARLILDYLDVNTFYSGAEFTEAIEAIPRELSKFYEKILSDIISRRNARSVQRLRAIFSWIAFAKRPLQTAELQSALLFDTAGGGFDRPVPTYVLETCGSLIERRKDSTLSFIHVSVKDYLQSSDCVETMRLSRQSSLWDNGLPSLRCLQAAFEVFSPSTEEITRNLQVIRGVWAFLPYTKEVWLSELLEMASVPVAKWNPLFKEMAQQLSKVLMTSRPNHNIYHTGAPVAGLEAIRPFDGLWYEATASLAAESKGQILAAETSDGDGFKKPHSIQDIHANYEWVIQQLIGITHHPDINSSELEYFRENLTRSAYACRFALCDTAKNKFRSRSERAAHEAAHAPAFPCPEPGCRYPPFISGRSLRRHQSENHGQGGHRNVNEALLIKQARPSNSKAKDGGGDKEKGKEAGPPPQPTPPQQAQSQHNMTHTLLANMPPHMLQPNQDEINTIRNHPRMAGAPLDAVVNLARQVKVREYVEKLQPNQDEIDIVRNHPRMAGAPLGAVVNLARQVKVRECVNKMQAQHALKAAQQQSGQGQQGQQGPPPAADGQTPIQIGQNQSPAQRPAVPASGTVPVPAANKKPTASAAPPVGNRNNMPNRAPAPGPSPAQAQPRSLKRPSPDEATEAASQQQAATTQQRAQIPSQPAQQPLGRSFPFLTPGQIARFAPEHKAKYEAMMKNAGPPEQPITQEQYNRLRAIMGAEMARNEQFPEIPMSNAEKAEMARKFKSVVDFFMKMNRSIARWYSITEDDARARMYFRTRCRVASQFADGDRFTRLNQSFSMNISDLDQALEMINNMIKDIANWVKERGEAGKPPGNQQQPQASQPVPLSAANLEENTKAHTQMHQRSNSKGGQVPAAPTTSQQPFAFGASSPHGQPAYLSKPTVTVDTLNPPPPKRMKVNPQQASSPAVQSSIASPQIKPPSPEIRRQAQPEPPKPPQTPMISCNEPGCEMSSVGFATEEARNLHIQEEHVRPNEDPFKFFNESIAASLGLDSQGQAKNAPIIGQAQPSAPPMAMTLSRQGQSGGRMDSATPTPMSRAASMNRQGSAAGPGPMGNVQGGMGAGTPRIADVNVGDSMPFGDDAWAGANVDPQDILSAFSSLDSSGGGVISDQSLCRSLTPNDTPESKDSGSSEPNSDISEGVNLDIDVNWAPVDQDFLVDMNNITMDAMDSMDPALAAMPAWEDVPNDFSKPFNFDTTGLYLLDTS